MAKKPKNKKPAVATTVEDVSTQSNETPKAEHLSVADADKLTIGNSMPDAIGVMPPIEAPDALKSVTTPPMSETPYGSTYATTPSSASGASKDSDDSNAMGPQTEPVKKENIGTRIMDKSLLVTQDDHFLREPKIAGNFKSDNLQQLLPTTVGFLAGRLYMFAFSAERYKLPEVSAWVENNITWAQPDQVDFYYFNHSTDRAHVRNYREKAKLSGRIAVGLLALPAHCLDMQPPHVIHSQEADGVFIYTGTQLIRNKLRCELEASLWPHTVTL